MGKVSFERYSNDSVRRGKRFERTSSDAARPVSFAASTDFTTTTVVKRAEAASVGDPEGSDNAETAFVARFGFWFSKITEKRSADGSETAAFSF